MGKSNKNGSKIKDLVLFALEKAVDGSAVFADFYENPWRFGYQGPRFEYPKPNLSKAISRLRNKGLVEKVIGEEQIILRLTDAGRDWILKQKDDAQIEWDGVWRIAIFDIPEKYKSVRNTFRNKLKGWGFAQWQRSVWVSKKPLTEELRKLVSDLKIDDWVLVIESTNTGK